MAQHRRIQGPSQALPGRAGLELRGYHAGSAGGGGEEDCGRE